MYGIGLLKGLAVTLKNAVLPERMFTVHQYPNRRASIIDLAKRQGTSPVNMVLKDPGTALKALLGLVWVEDRMVQHPRFRGEEFTWYEERCTACASCAKYCPLGIIRIVTHPAGVDVDEGGKYAIDVFDIDIGRCMFCGLCVEACPYDALHMGSGFEEGKYSRRNLVITVDKLRSAPKRPSTWFRPQLEARAYNPHTGKDASWKEVGRHDKPDLDTLEKRWVER